MPAVSSELLLKLYLQIQRSNISCKTPTVVHCRDGLGRTGMFILLELALKKLVRDGDKIKVTISKLQLETILFALMNFRAAYLN